MQYNQESLNEKMKHLDEILEYQDILEDVISSHFDMPYSVELQKRKWVGGGGTSYLININGGKIFLKVKSRFVTVESKLEEEEGYIGESCLFHECRMLRTAAAAKVNVPNVIFYEERDNFEFLAIEYIDLSLNDRLESASIEESIHLYKDLESNVRKLFEAGFVHSDLHEYNMRVDSSKPDKIVLIDFEECRELKQDCDFEHSLDYMGMNSKSSLGEFPLCNEQKYTVRINCLQRMRQVFKKYVAEKTMEYIEECNYDSSNGICITIDHGKSEKTYQSITNSYFNISGQREMGDKRCVIVKKLCDLLFAKEDFVFMDVGSNNGLFCREISQYTDGRIQCIGLEGFFKFNILARALAFLDDCKNIYYYDFLCGEDDLSIVPVDKQCFMTICSVWHHIQHKEIFLSQLKQIDLKYIFLEMAVQEECYKSHAWEAEIDTFMEVLEFADKLKIGHSMDYNRPLLLLSKEVLSDYQKKEIEKISNEVFHIKRSQHIIKLLKKIQRYFSAVCQ